MSDSVTLTKTEIKDHDKKYYAIKCLKYTNRVICFKNNANQPVNQSKEMHPRKLSSVLLEKRCRK